MCFTDRGIGELGERRGEGQVTLGWLAGRLTAFVDLHPDFGSGRALSRPASGDEVTLIGAGATGASACAPVTAWQRPTRLGYPGGTDGRRGHLRVPDRRGPPARC